MLKANETAEIGHDLPRRIRRGVGSVCASLLGLALVLAPASMVAAQYSGPAPTKADSPNPNNEGLVQRTPAERMPGNPIVLHSGDLIGVSIYGVPDYKMNARIAGDGVAYLPLIGGVHLAGMTVEQAQQSVTQKLVDGQFMLAPDVLISIEDSSVDVIGVMGEVYNPRAIPAFAPMSLLDALSAAGGLKPDASHSISILRKSMDEPLLVMLNSNPAKAVAQNIPLYPGDRVLVPRIGVVYVVGAVLHNGAYPLNPDTPTTLMQMVTVSGGPGFQAQKSDTRIIRTTGGTRREIKVDLGKVMSGKIPDPIMQNDDIVLIPTNEIKAAIKGGGIGIAMGLVYAIPLL